MLALEAKPLGARGRAPAPSCEVLAVAASPTGRARRCTAPGCCAGAGRCSRPCIPTDVRRRGRILLNQQLWLWGQDIRRPEGNALIAYGFARSTPPEGQRGSNTYLLRLPDGASILLWAFGFFYQREELGGVFLPRFGFTPRLARCAAPPEGVWSATQLRDCCPPHGAQAWARAHRLFIPALRWVADYERWVLGARGADYRRSCVGSWQKEQVPAEGLDGAWDALAEACDAAMRAFIAARA